MIKPRIIPILSINNRKLVKTVRYKKPNYLGDPINAIKIFNDKEVDELAVIDIRATIENKEPDYQHLFEMAGEAFMPMAYGGGIKSFDQAKKIFDCGFEKVILNTAFFAQPNLSSQIAATYGNQSVVVSLDVSKSLFGKLTVTTQSGTKKLKLNLQEALNLINQSDAGELLLNDIQNEGTFAGYNLPLIKQVSQQLNIPVIANCGAKDNQSFKDALQNGASACAASSIFVYKNNNPQSILINYFPISS